MRETHEAPAFRNVLPLFSFTFLFYKPMASNLFFFFFFFIKSPRELSGFSTNSHPSFKERFSYACCFKRFLITGEPQSTLLISCAN